MKLAIEALLSALSVCNLVSISQLSDGDGVVAYSADTMSALGVRFNQARLGQNVPTAEKASRIIKSKVTDILNTLPYITSLYGG